MYTQRFASVHIGSILRYGVIGILIGIFVLYLVWQGRFLLTGPIVTFAQVPEVEQRDRVVVVTGTAENIVRITLNGREISTTRDGYFEEVIVLENGYTVSTITAFDRYGRSRSYEHTFVYTPAFTSRATTSLSRI